MSNNIAIGVFIDKKHRLWIPTFNGLNVIDERSTRINQLYKSNGIKNNEYNFNSFYFDNQEKLYLGGINGYEYIKTSEFNFKIDINKIQISEIINVNPLNGKQNSVLINDNNLNVDLSKYVCRIKFSPTEYFFSNTLKYYIKIPELSNEWLDLDNNPNARLYNIPRGNYTLIFKAIDNREYSKPYYRVIHLNVDQIFYKRRWFIPSISILTIFLAAFVIYTRRKNAETKFKLAQKNIIEKELQEALNQQRDLNNLRSKFISMISHEYRTPLAGIQTSIDLISILESMNDELASEKRKKYINNVKHEIQRLVEIINGVVSINKSGEKFVNAKFELFEIFDIINIITNDYIIKVKPLKIITKNHLQQKTYCSLDFETFKNAINLILNNAQKFGYKDTLIEVDIRSENEKNLVISIKDYGIGIPKNEISKIFELFYRGSNIGNKPGLGLGLSMANEFIKLHHGEIKIISEIKKFTIVEIHLPILSGEKNV